MKMKKTDKRDLKNRLVSLYAPTSEQAEYFRTIKTNIEMLNIDMQFQTILVTSPTQDSGKTMIASNLAATYAQCGKKTLLIDLDLRKPSLRFVFPKANLSMGLTGLLGSSQSIPLEDAIVEIVQGEFDILPVGTRPSSPYAILNSKKMGQLLSILKGHYDVIIIDTPPVLPVTDALLISKWVDGCVFVAKNGYSKKQEVRKAIKMFKDANAPIIGTIFNNTQMKKLDYYYTERDA